MSNDVDNFLAHYGVKGMRWGVRKKEESGGSSKGSLNPIASLKAHNLKVNTEYHNTIKARIEKSNVRVSEIKSQLSKLDGKTLSKDQKASKKELTNMLSEHETRIVKDSKFVSKGPTSGMTPKQKKVLVGVATGLAAAAAIGLTVYAVYNADEIAASSRTLSTRLATGDIFKKNAAFAKYDNPNDVLKNVVKGVNPNYKKAGGMMNCRRTTFAYELRRRGYDVSATTSSIGRGQSETGLVNALIRGDKNVRSFASVSSFARSMDSPSAAIRTRAVASDKRIYKAFTKGIDFTDEDPVYGWWGSMDKHVSKLVDAFNEQPNGARGEIAFNMKAFVHSMQYEIFDGVPHIFDSQKAAHYPVTAEGLEKLFNKWGKAGGVALTRLDDVDLDLEFLSQWVRS